MNSSESGHVHDAPPEPVVEDATEAVGSLSGRENGRYGKDHGRGDTLGRYMVLDRLGSGGMGVVYSAYDPELDRKVAIKVLRPDLVSVQDQEDSIADQSHLLREAKVMAKLSHPNVLPVFDVGTVAGQVFIATELVDGCTLSEWLRTKRSRREIVHHFIAAGRGLAAAHAAGLVHRDFKPGNVLVGNDGTIRVMDFGLARHHDASPEVRGTASQSDSEETAGHSVMTGTSTQREMVIGTPPYMAPEQHKGSTVDAAADQYSFCVALYRGLYGQLPFAPRRGPRLLEAKEALELAPVTSSTNVPGWLRRVVLKGLQPDPAKRWSSMTDLLIALGRDPRKTTTRATAASLALVGALTGGWAYGKAQERQAALCAGGSARLTGIWDDDIQNRVEAAFLATNKSYAAETWNNVRSTIQNYSSQWADLHRDTCEATHIRREQSAATLDLRMACLDARLFHLEAMTGLLARADDQVVQTAVHATYALPSIDDCNKLDRLQRGPKPPPGGHAPAVHRLQKRLAQANALYHAGKFGEALPLAETVLTEARALEYAPLTAEATFMLGIIQYGAGQFEEAVENLSDSGWQAESNEQDELAAQAQIALVSLVGDSLHRKEEALTWARHAQAAVERLGAAPEREGELASAVGDVHRVNGGLDQARSHYEEALQTLTRALGPRHLFVGSLHHRLGDVWAEERLFDRAQSQYEQSMRIHQEQLGAKHPRIGVLHASMGLELSRTGSLAAAREHLDRALPMLIESLGPEHAQVGFAKQGLANVARYERDLSTASRLYREAFEIQEESLGSDNPAIMEPLLLQAQTLIDDKRFDEAAHVLDEARDLVDASWVSNDEMVARLALALGELHSVQGRHQDAINEFDRGISRVEKVERAEGLSSTLQLLRARSLRALGRAEEAVTAAERSVELGARAEPQILGKAEFELALALAHTGGPTQRAHDHAKKAAESFAAAGETFAEERRVVLDWMKTLTSE